MFLPKASQTRLRISGLVVALSAAFAMIPVSLESADANGDTRTISIMNVHTNEMATVTFKRNGYYDAEGIKQLSWLLRDWRKDEPTSMSPRLFDILWEVHQETGSQEPFHAVSGYRSPETNAMLRRSSRGVAEHSQHMLGRAMDSYLPDVPVERMREIAMRLQRGGVGYYPTAGSPFVHIDAGSVRAWPRMTREQLARLFPDGKTVHLPPDGHPFPGYDQAKSEILAAGGTVAGITAYAEAEPQEGGGHHKSLWAALFGGVDEDEDATLASGGRGSTSRSVAGRQPTRVAALAPRNDDDGVRSLMLAAAQSQTDASVQPSPAPAAAEHGRSRRGATAKTAPASAPPPQPAAVASAAPNSGFLPGLFGGPRVEAMPAQAAAPADTGTTVAMRSNTQGPTGTTVIGRSDAEPRDEGADTSLVAAFAPLPPRRPKSLADVAALADIPLPPARPTDLDTTVAPAPTDTPAATTEPAPDAGKLVSLDHPLPPIRPQGFTLAGPTPATASTPDALTASPVAPATNSTAPGAPAAAADQANGTLLPAEKAEPPAQLVRLDHPLPPSRPTTLASANAPPANLSSAGQLPAAAQSSAPRPVVKPDKDNLEALFGSVAIISAQRANPASVKVANSVVRTALPRVAQEAIAQPSSAAGHFQASSAPTPVVNRFSGKAVQPLSSLGFTTR
jgi:uncharacterized protein YcbK (DUF882 family)